VELTVLDGETWWSLDGREQQRHDLAFPGRGATRLEIGVAGEATFRNLRVERDIVYEAPDGRAAYDVPKDGFFFIGDNVKESDDSRKWTASVFHAPNGETLVAADELPDEMGNMKRGNIKSDGSAWRFTDADGVRREIPRTGTKVESNVPYPFARRDHLVGRAVMIAFPWTISDAGFRPRLLP
jgi:hypothetical protein